MDFGKENCNDNLSCMIPLNLSRGRRSESMVFQMAPKVARVVVRQRRGDLSNYQSIVSRRGERVR